MSFLTLMPLQLKILKLPIIGAVLVTTLSSTVIRMATATEKDARPSKDMKTVRNVFCLLFASCSLYFASECIQNVAVNIWICTTYKNINVLLITLKLKWFNTFKFWFPWPVYLQSKTLKLKKFLTSWLIAITYCMIETNTLQNRADFLDVLLNPDYYYLCQQRSAAQV